MRLVTTILAGALVLGGAMFGCSSDSDDGGTSGTGGATGATGGKGGTGGGATTGGAGGTGGTAAIDCTTAAGVTECKRIATEENACGEVSNCGCDNCTCELQACQALPDCVALRQCVVRTACCPSTDASCTGQRPACTDADQCGPEVTAASTNGGVAEALTLGTCTFNAGCPSFCGDGG